MEKREVALSVAKTWLGNAQKEYKWYLRICRPDSKQHKPIEYPEGGLPHLQQTIEKAIKALAIASGYDIAKVGL